MLLLPCSLTAFFGYAKHRMQQLALYYTRFSHTYETCELVTHLCTQPPLPPRFPEHQTLQSELQATTIHADIDKFLTKF